MQDPSPPPLESALLTHASSSTKRGQPWCDHCRKPGHVLEECWKIHGKPANWKARSSKDASSSTRDHSPKSGAILTKAQIIEIQKLFEKFQGTKEAHLTIVESEGTLFPTALVTSQIDPVWILDSGASDHMTGDRNLFHTLSPVRDESLQKRDFSHSN
ncbi:hypothetical protein V6N13_140593 [Hibiscus sabdariffa]